MHLVCCQSAASLLRVYKMHQTGGCACQRQMTPPTATTVVATAASFSCARRVLVASIAACSSAEAHEPSTPLRCVAVW
jgi:hypothetical protein